MSLVISVGTLGSLAMPGFCPRCFWIKLKCERLPFQIPMPGIFSSIDSYVKNVVRRYYDREKKLPDWFPYIGKIAGLAEIPSYQRFSVTEPHSGATLRGVPDEVLQLEDGSYHIVDYKTSRLTKAQGWVFPMYEVQLNAYAYIGNRTCFSPVSKLSLMYLEPDTNFAENPALLDRSEDCLMLGFTPTIKSVEIKADSYIEGLLQRASKISEEEAPPHHNNRCKDCEALEGLIEIALAESWEREA